MPSSERSRFSAVFISNATRCIPLFAQRAAGERLVMLSVRNMFNANADVALLEKAQNNVTRKVMMRQKPRFCRMAGTRKRNARIQLHTLESQRSEMICVRFLKYFRD